MMLAAPEFIVAKGIELLDEIEVAAELQHRMFADRMVRGKEGSEFEACHGVSLRAAIVVGSGYVLECGKAITEKAADNAWL
jgi:hypothetical protein